MKIIDLTHTYRPGMTGMSKWHPVVTFTQLAHIEEVNMNTSSILLGSHIGTHMDAACHQIIGGYSVEATPLEYCVGDVTIVDATHRGQEEGGCLQVCDLEKYDLKQRVLVNFGYSKYYKDPEKYNKGYPYISMDAAKYMLEKGVKLVAMDTCSVDPPASETPGHPFPVHKYTMQYGMIFVEALDHTDEIDPSKEYEFVALPLKLQGVDGSPCRVILIEKE